MVHRVQKLAYKSQTRLVHLARWQGTRHPSEQLAERLRPFRLEVRSHDKQWYYHKFYAEQPDLNWRNPAVEKAMFDSVRFWLDRGVAGFRLDAIPTLFEDPQLRDEKEIGGTNAYGDPNLDDSYTENLPEVHDVMRRLRKLVASYPGDRVLIGETYLPNIQELDKWYGGAATTS